MERLEPYEHPELGAQMRTCQTLGGYVRYSDYEKLEAENRRKEQIRESEVVEAEERRNCHENLRRRAERERDQERQRIEEERCESCDDTGIYTEGDEWAPCGECDLGRGFAERLKTHAEETRQSERQRIQEALKERAAAKVKEAEKRVAGERPKDRHERLKELLGSDWPVVTLMRDTGGKSSPPWVWWMEDNGYDHDKYEVEHYLPIAAFDTLLDTLDPSDEDHSAHEILREAAGLDPSGEQGEESRSLDDEDRERLENIALSLLGRGYHEPPANQAAFLRKLATDTSKEVGGDGE